MSRHTTVLMVLLVVLAGCSAAGGSVQTGEEASRANVDAAYEGGAGGDAARESGGDGGAAANDAANAESAEGAAPAVQNRELIRTARVTVVVGDFEAARERLAGYTEATGGFVGDSSRRVEGEGNRTWTVGRMTLRIPTGNYSEALRFVNETGEVRATEQSTRDVTDQMVDLEARLENLREERDQLRTLYRRANTTEDVLAVQRELSRVQTEIERTEAQLQQLERKVTFTTITVELRERRPDDDDREPSWYDTPVVTAFLESVDGVVVFLQSTVVLTAYALPYLVVVGVPLGGGLYAVRRFRRRRGSSAAATPPTDGETDSDGAAGDTDTSDGDDTRDPDDDGGDTSE